MRSLTGVSLESLAVVPFEILSRNLPIISKGVPLETPSEVPLRIPDGAPLENPLGLQPEISLAVSPVILLEVPKEFYR